MLKKSTLLHLRIPFSLYLLPFFCFAVSQATHIHFQNLIVSCLIIHLLIYPASNGYNSYFDKDEESIGGLKNPPKVNKELYYTSLMMDLVALLLSFLVSYEFFLLVFLLGLASKAYSHPSIRLKKYPIIGLLTVSFFQGAFTYGMSILAIQGLPLHDLFHLEILKPACLCSLLLLGSYPMTQIYQHGEDGRRGDKTISRMLGIHGTFYWTAVIFCLSIAGFYFYFTVRYPQFIFFALIFFLTPTLVFFIQWFLKVLQDEKNANFESTMKLNALSSFGFIGFFTLLTLYGFYFM